MDYETSLWNNSRELSAIVKYGFITEIKAGKVQRQKFDMMGLLRQRGDDEEVSSPVLHVQGRRRRDLPRGHERDFGAS